MDNLTKSHHKPTRPDLGARPRTPLAAIVERTPAETATTADGLLADAKEPKVELCHYSADDDYYYINVSGNALEAHLEHHEDVPYGEEEGEMLCEPEPEDGCPCFTAEYLASVEFEYFCAYDEEAFLAPPFAGVCLDIEGVCGPSVGFNLCAAEELTGEEAPVITPEQALACEALVIAEAANQELENECNGPVAPTLQSLDASSRWQR